MSETSGPGRRDDYENVLRSSPGVFADIRNRSGCELFSRPDTRYFLEVRYPSMSIDPIRTVTRELGDKVLCAAAICAVIRARSEAQTADVPIPEPLQRVIQVLGIESALREADPQALNALAANLGMTLLQAVELMQFGGPEHSWSSSDPALLQAAGEVSRGFPLSFAKLLPALAGLGERLSQPGAAFLDIGVGVACLSISMASLWPELRIVGIDPWEPSIAIARQNVREAGLEARIALREGTAEELNETSAYDLVWLPTVFIRASALPSILNNTLRALRPGGWLLVATMFVPEDPLEAALARLRVGMMGGALWEQENVESLLAKEGFVSVRPLPSPPASPVRLTAGQASSGAVH